MGKRGYDINKDALSFIEIFLVCSRKYDTNIQQKYYKNIVGSATETKSADCIICSFIVLFKSYI